MRFPDAPMRFTQMDLDRLLAWAADQGASDVHLQSLRPPHINRYRRILPVTDRALSLPELHSLTNAVCGEGATASISGGAPRDPHYQYTDKTGKSYRFRVNATACEVEGERGIHLVFRCIPPIPPPLAAFDLPERLRQWLLIENRGLVLVTGPTGSGKTTLMAAAIRTIAEDPQRSEVILTFEAPIEYVYPADHIALADTVIVQSTVGDGNVKGDISTWDEAARNLLRRAPTLVLFGETRDRETLRAVIQGAATGHAIFTTQHVRGVPEVHTRVVYLFDDQERRAAIVDLLDVLHLLVSVWLVPATDGKRVQLREYLCIDQDIRERLYGVAPEHQSQTLRRLLPEYGQTFLQDAEARRREGFISAETLAWIQRLYHHKP